MRQLLLTCLLALTMTAAIAQSKKEPTFRELLDKASSEVSLQKYPIKKIPVEKSNISYYILAGGLAFFALGMFFLLRKPTPEV